MSPMPRYAYRKRWRALKEAWRRYKAAETEKNETNMKVYALRIKTLHKELGILPYADIREIQKK